MQCQYINDDVVVYCKLENQLIKVEIRVLLIDSVDCCKNSPSKMPGRSIRCKMRFHLALAEDPLALGGIYPIKYSQNYTYFI